MTLDEEDNGNDNDDDDDYTVGHTHTHTQRDSSAADNDDLNDVHTTIKMKCCFRQCVPAVNCAAAAVVGLSVG